MADQGLLDKIAIAEPVQNEPKPEPKPEVKPEPDKIEEPEDKKTESEPKPEKKEEEPKPKRSERQYHRLLQQRAAAEAENKILKERIEKLESGEGEEPVQRQAADVKPKRENFQTQEDYDNARDAYYDHKIEFAEKRGREAAANEFRNREVQERLNDFKKDHPDYDTVIHEAEEDGMQATDLVVSLLREEPNPGEIAYYFASSDKGRDDLDRINKLPEKRAAMELGKLSVRISNTSPKPEKENPGERKVSHAPEPPPKTAPGSGTPASAERMTDTDYIEDWKKKKFKRE